MSPKQSAAQAPPDDQCDRALREARVFGLSRAFDVGERRL
jgi:hypothetical protein